MQRNLDILVVIALMVPAAALMLHIIEKGWRGGGEA